MSLAQALIALLSGAGVFFISIGWTVPGCALGLMAQPFWVRETFRARQWGMFALSLWYSFAWLNGLVLNWSK